MKAFLFLFCAIFFLPPWLFSKDKLAEIYPIYLRLQNKEVCVSDFSLPQNLVCLYTKNASSKPKASIGAFSRLGFLKENKDVGLNTSIYFGKNLRSSFSLAYQFYGFSAYNTSSIQLSYGHSFGEKSHANIFYGLSIPKKIEDAEILYSSSVGLSFYQQIGYQWLVGFVSTYDFPYKKQKLWNKALYLEVFCSYAINKDLGIGFSLSKDIRYSIEASTSISYLIKKHFLCYGSIAVYPFKYSLGFGYTSKAVDILVKAAYHPPLGATGGVSISYKI